MTIPTAPHLPEPCWLLASDDLWGDGLDWHYPTLAEADQAWLTMFGEHADDQLTDAEFSAERGLTVETGVAFLKSVRRAPESCIVLTACAGCGTPFDDGDEVHVYASDLAGGRRCGGWALINDLPHCPACLPATPTTIPNWSTR